MIRRFALLLTVLVLSTSAVHAQTCCQISKPLSTHAEELAIYASPEFVRAHLAPLPFTFVSENGSMISFPTNGGPEGRAFFISAAKATGKYLFVYHEWWGLNDYIKQEAEKWQKDLGDVNVIAVDLFDGEVAATPEQAQKLAGAAKPERMVEIIKGAIAYAEKRAGGKKLEAASIGWCFGGGWALQSSLLAGSHTNATVMYYGMPELDQKKLIALRGPVIEFFGVKDNFINQEKKAAFEKAMKKAGKSLETHTYDAEHAFANPSNPKYDPKATADAHKRALSFLKKNFAR